MHHGHLCTSLFKMAWWWRLKTLHLIHSGTLEACPADQQQRRWCQPNWDLTKWGCTTAEGVRNHFWNHNPREVSSDRQDSLDLDPQSLMFFLAREYMWPLCDPSRAGSLTAVSRQRKPKGIQRFNYHNCGNTESLFPSTISSSNLYWNISQ